jgi:hypothetical protein
VVIGRDCAVNGGLRVYIPSKCVVVVRRYAKPGSLSSDIITLMNKRAKECRQIDLADRVVRIGGTVPPNMTPSLPEHSRGGHMPASSPPRGAPQSTNVQSPVVVDSSRMDPSQTLSLPVERELPEYVNVPSPSSTRTFLGRETSQGSRFPLHLTGLLRPLKADRIHHRQLFQTHRRLQGVVKLQAADILSMTAAPPTRTLVGRMASSPS